MKRFAALLIVLLLLLNAPALALDGKGYPAWDGMTMPDNGLYGAFGEDYISLSFDPAAEYSNVLDGLIQACFFAYDATEQTYIEMYLMIPQDVVSGDILRSDDGGDSAIYLYETAIGSENFYYAGDPGAKRAEDAGSFEMTIESVESSAAAITMRGKLTAQLCRYDSDALSQEFLNLREAHFSFTLPLTGSAFAPAPTQEPNFSFPNLPDAQAPDAGTPAFTLPPYYVTL